MENVIEIKNLNKIYDDFRLENITLNIPRGSVVGLIGENGAGKSTLIRSLLGVIKSSSDELKIFGLDLKTDEINSCGIDWRKWCWQINAHSFSFRSY